jgi:hypothetical protein
MRVIVHSFQRNSNSEDNSGRFWGGCCPAEVRDDEPAVFRANMAAARQAMLSEERLQTLAEALFDEAHRAIFEDPVSRPSLQAVQRCLRDRGFNLARLDRLPLGWCQSRENLRDHLLRAGFTSEELGASRLLADRRLSGRIVGPIRDRQQRIVSFWAIHPNGHPPKYLFWKSPRAHQLGVFGVDLAYDSVAEGPSDLVLVEDLLDALLLQSRGLLRVAAVGGPGYELTSRRWQRLYDLGVRRVTLALKQDYCGARATRAALEHAFRAQRSPSVWVLAPGSRSPLASADRWVPFEISPGHESTLRGQCIHGYRYLALSILETHKPGQQWGDDARRRAWAEASEVYRSRRPDQTADLDTHFVPPLVAELGIPLAGQTPRYAVWEPPLEISRLPTSRKANVGRVSRTAGARTGYCQLHNCPQTECFCFD